MGERVRVGVVQTPPARGGRGVVGAAETVRRVLLGLPPRTSWYLRAKAKITT